MNAAAIFGKGISFPPRVNAQGRLAWSEGETNIRESIKVILLTNFNERVRLPSFGGNLQEFLFQPNNPGSHHQMRDRIERVLRLWEPRISVESVTVQPDLDDLEAAIATIYYKLIATQSRERLTLSLSLRS